LIKDKSGNSKGFAYIEFDTEAAAQASLSMHGTQLKGRTLKVTISTPPDKNKARKAKDQPGEVNPLAVFITGIPAGVNEEKLKELFAQCGTIKEVRLVKDKITGQLKGFAYIDFETTEATEVALKMDQTQMYGKPIRVHRSVSTLRNKPEETAAEPVSTEKEPEFK
jgi:RNA recognition motif-containing protein